MEDLRKAAKYYLETASEEYKERESRATGGGESPVDFYIRETKRCIRKCDVCGELLFGFYLCCTECEIYQQGDNYNLCVNCFYGGTETFQHNHNSFADNHTVLAMHNEKRSKPTCVLEKYEGSGKQDSNRNSSSHSYPLRRTPSSKNSSRSNSFRRTPSFKNSSRSRSIVQVSSSKHLNPSNSIILVSNFSNNISVSERKITIDKEGIEKLAHIAEAHYNAAPEKIKNSADKFFWSMVKQRGKTTVSMEDFVESMKEKRFPEYAYPELFEKVVKNRDMGMSIEESRTVYYIVLSGRPFCSWCNCFIPDVYFCCSKCSARSYALCLRCYSSKAYCMHSHYGDDDAFFLDYTVLHTTIKATSATASNPPEESGSSSMAIVKTDPRVKVGTVLKIGTAILNAGGTILTIASTLGACTIM